MQFLKNKHLILAMFVTPVLAVIAYFAVDHVVSEQPHAAIDGASYKLAARSNCRYKSGLCTLENGDIEVKIRAETVGGDQLKISLSSVFPVQSVLLSLVDEVGDENESSEPTPMKTSAGQPDIWSANINKIPSDKSILRLALSISDTLYYAETTMVFMDYETSFPRENFSN